MNTRSTRITAPRLTPACAEAYDHEDMEGYVVPHDRHDDCPGYGRGDGGAEYDCLCVCHFEQVA